MSEFTILQRVRQVSPPADYETIPGKPIDPAEWLRDAERLYWQPASSGNPANPSIALSADTFFNAFFAAYWRQLTGLRSLSLRLRLKGRFLVQLHRNSLQGKEVLHSVKATRGEDGFRFDFPAEGADLPGLRYNFSISALDKTAEFLGGEWITADPAPAPIRLTIAITTHNRPSFAEATVRKILADPALAAGEVRLLVIDQSDEAKLEHLQSERCRVIPQKNLGGAGGFARAMYEQAYRTNDSWSTHLLLMDDDLHIETDSILRALRLAQYAVKPVILGGTMLDLTLPACLPCLGDFFSNEKGYHRITQHLRNLNGAHPESLQQMSEPKPIDYCGWWFCLISMETIRRLQLPYPFFIKADDIEYGLRAKAAGIPSQTIPGIGVWHLPFGLKQAPWVYCVEQYNHLLVNALSGLSEVTEALRSHCFQTALLLKKGHLSFAAARIVAIEKFLLGWKYFRSRTAPDWIAALRSQLAKFDVAAGTPEAPGLEAELQERLRLLVLRFGAEIKPTVEAFHRRLPATRTTESWQPYFKSGNLLHLPE